METFIIIAQAVDPTTGLAGSSGWFGCGLLGLVLAWYLLIQTPRQDARADAKDRLFMEQLDKKEEAHKDAVKLLTDHCHQELDTITKTYIEKVDILANYFRNAQQQK